MELLPWPSLPVYDWLFPKRELKEDRKACVETAEGALIFDRETRHYKLRQDLFDKAIAEAADVMWSDRKTKTDKHDTHAEP
jgi:hypothetical protein